MPSTIMIWDHLLEHIAAIKIELFQEMDEMSLPLHSHIAMWDHM
jgi:hypothetical protein